jgi:hypothetical protein
MVEWREAYADVLRYRVDDPSRLENHIVEWEGTMKNQLIENPEVFHGPDIISCSPLILRCKTSNPTP